MKFTLPFPPSSNTAYPTARNGRRITSAKLKQWRENAPSLDFKVDGEVFISYLIYFPSDHLRDGQNYLKVPLDYIVSQGVIEDDNRRILKGERWDDGGIDKINPRIEIIITKLGQTTQ